MIKYQQCKLKDENIKKATKILLIILTLLIVMTGSIYIALQSSIVQTFLTRKLAKELSSRIDANITIGKVDISLFQKILLKDVMLEDQQSDTLLFV